MSEILFTNAAYLEGYLCKRTIMPMLADLRSHDGRLSCDSL